MPCLRGDCAKKEVQSDFGEGLPHMKGMSRWSARDAEFQVPSPLRGSPTGLGLDPQNRANTLPERLQSKQSYGLEWSEDVRLL